MINLYLLFSYFSSHLRRHFLSRPSLLLSRHLLLLQFLLLPLLQPLFLPRLLPLPLLQPLFLSLLLYRPSLLLSRHALLLSRLLCLLKRSLLCILQNMKIIIMQASLGLSAGIRQNPILAELEAVHLDLACSATAGNFEV